MRKLAMVLILASVATFLIASLLVLLNVQATQIGIHTGAEGFSRASSNLALIAIALGVWFRIGNDDD